MFLVNVPQTTFFPTKEMIIRFGCFSEAEDHGVDEKISMEFHYFRKCVIITLGLLKVLIL